MAPEQMQAGAVDVRADIWSLGAILYECMSNAPAFDSETLPGICAQVLSQEPRPIRELAPHIPDRLAAIIDRCMRKNRDERFANVAELAEALAPFGTERAGLSKRRITTLLSLGSVDSTQLVDAPFGLDMQAQTAVVDTGSVLAAMAASSPSATQASTTVGRGMSVDVASSRGIAGLPKRRVVWPFVTVPLIGVAALAGAYFAMKGTDRASTEDSASLALPSVAQEPPTAADVVTIRPLEAQPLEEASTDEPSADEPATTDEAAEQDEAMKVSPAANATVQPAPVNKPPNKKSTQRPPKDTTSKDPKAKAPDAWDPNNFGGRQ
jgi:serine/threonine-protein kinase